MAFPDGTADFRSRSHLRNSPPRQRGRAMGRKGRVSAAVNHQINAHRQIVHRADPGRIAGGFLAGADDLGRFRDAMGQVLADIGGNRTIADDCNRIAAFTAQIARHSKTKGR